MWIGYLLACPLRRLVDNPEKLLSPYIRPGMTVIDAGCAMGYFSLPMAKMVGPGGKVICIDLQEKMVQKLYRRAKKKNLLSPIEARVCTRDHLNIDDLQDVADFALAYAVVHEVSDVSSFYTELCSALREGGKLLIGEPSSHVSALAFDIEVDAAGKCGFTLLDRSKFTGRRLALFQKNPN